MRNIREYPITTTEKLLWIDAQIEAEEAKLASGDAGVGDITLLILREIKENVKFASDEYNRRTVREAGMRSSMSSMAAQMSADVVPR